MKTSGEKEKSTVIIYTCVE